MSKNALPNEEAEMGFEPEPGFYALDLESYNQQQRQTNSWFQRKKPWRRIGTVFYIFQVK